MADMIELSALAFKVETKELVEAVEQTKNLKIAVDGLNAPLKEVSVSARSAGKAIATVASGGGTSKKPDTEIDKITRVIEKQIQSMRVLRNQSVKTADGSIKLGDGFTKSQSGSLAMLKMLGATTDQLQKLSASFKQYNDITGLNTFDKSASGLSKINKQIQELKQVNDLAARGLRLTRDEIIDLSRDMLRVEQSFTGSVRTQQLAKLEKEFVAAAQERDKYLSQAKQSELAAKIAADERAESELAGMRMNNEAVKLFQKNEKAKQNELLRTQREIEQQLNLQNKLAAQSRYSEQGISSGIASRAAGMEIRGVPQEAIKSYIKQAQATELATKSSRDMARATAYLTELDQRLDAQLDQTNANLGGRYTDSLVKAKNALQASGVATDVAASRLQNYQTKLNQVAALERKRELSYLARGIGVQMGDVGVSLAGGMNPLLVMIQQGDQIRGLLQQVDVQGKEMAATMNQAAGQIASSFKLTGQAIGGFFLGAVMSAGRGVANLAKELPLLGSGMKAVNVEMQNLRDFELRNGPVQQMSLLYRSISALVTITTFAAGAFVAFAAVVAGSMLVALFKAMKQHDELVKSLTLGAGALNISTDSAYQYADAMKEMGYRSSDTLKVIALMGKTGVLTAGNIKDVTIAAQDLQRYGGVAIEDTVKVFADLAKDPVDALMKIASATGMVSAETIRNVRELQTQGDTFAAQELAIKSYVDVAAQQTARLKSELNSLGIFFKDLGKGIGDIFDGIVNEMSNLFRKTTLSRELALIDDSLSKGVRYTSAQGNLQDRRKVILEQLRIEAQTEDFRKAQTEREVKQRKLDEEAAKYALANLSKEEAYYRNINLLLKKRQEAIKAGSPSQTVDGFDSQIRRVAQVYAKDSAVSDNRPKPRTTDTATEEQKELNKALEFYNDLINKADGYTSSFNDDVKRLNTLLNSKDKSKVITLNQYNEALLELNKRQPGYIAAMKEEEESAKALAEANKLNAEARASLSEVTADIVAGSNELSLSYEAEANAVFMSAEAKDRYVKVQKIELEYAAALLKINKDVTEKYSKGARVDASAITAALQAAVDAKEVALNLIDRQASLKSLSEIVNRVRTDLGSAMYDAITGNAKEAGQTLRKLLEEELLKKPLRVMIDAQVNQLLNSAKSGGIVDSFKGMLGDKADPNSLIGTLSSFSKDFGSYFKAGQADLLNGGSPFMAASGYFKSGMYGKAAGTAMGAASSYLGMYTAGKSVGTMISDGYSLNGGSGNTAMNVGAIAGAIFGGPFGAALGAALGGVVNRVFGKKFAGSEITGQFSSEGFSGSRIDKYKGGLFRSDSRKTSALSSDVTDPISQAFLEIKDETLLLAEALNIGTTGIENFKKTITVDLSGLSEEDAVKKFSEVLETVQDDLASTISALKLYQRTGEKSSDTLKRLNASMFVVNDVFELLGTTMYEVSIAGADMASQLTDAFGGVDNFSQQMQFFFENFYNEEDRLKLKTAELVREFDKLGFTLPNSREELAKLAEQQDRNTKYGRETYAALIGLSMAFDEITPKLDTLAGKFGNLIGTIFDNLSAELDKQIANSQQAATEAKRISEEYLTVAKSLREYAKGLRSSSTSSGTSYRSTLAAAQGGDVESMQKLTTAADDYIESIRNSSSSSVEFNKAVAKIQQDIFKVADTAQSEGVVKGYQARLLDVNTEILQQLKDSIVNQTATAESVQKQLDSLKEIERLFATQGQTLNSIDVTAEATLEVDRLIKDATKESELELIDIVNKLDSDSLSFASLIASTQAGTNTVSGLLSSILNQLKVNQGTAEENEETSDTGTVNNNLQLETAQLLLKTIRDAGLTEATNLSSVYDSLANSEEYRFAQFAAEAFGDYSLLLQAESELSSLRDRKDTVIANLERDLEAQREIIRGLGGVPQFANGGMHTGGLRLVGENGPELEVTGPSRIYNASQTASMLQGSNSDTAELMEVLIKKVDLLEAAARSTAVSNNKMAKILDRVSPDGNSLQITTAA